MNELVEQALWSLAVDDAQPVELRHPALVGAVLKDPEELRWFRVVQALALHRDRPIRGGLSVDALRRALRNDAVDEEPAGGLSAGSDRHTESLALYVLLEFPSEQNESALAAAQRLISAQSADDDFGRNPLSTSLAFLAMDFTARGGPAWQRCRTQLLRGQRPDGTWRHPASDVRDTASTVRVFREDPAFTTHALPAAVAFLCASQNDDGGWPARRGTDSDCGTTAQVLSALAGLGVPDLVIRRALGYLERRRTPQGLWSCHVAGDSDEPYEETVAQVVSALRHYRRPDTPPTERARAWLLDERLRLGHPEPGRYRGTPTRCSVRWRPSDGRSQRWPRSSAASPDCRTATVDGPTRRGPERFGTHRPCPCRAGSGRDPGRGVVGDRYRLSGLRPTRRRHLGG